MYEEDKDVMDDELKMANMHEENPVVDDGTDTDTDDSTDDEEEEEEEEDGEEDEE